MPNVVDFFVLKDDYEEAKARNWKPGKDVYLFIIIPLFRFTFVLIL